MRPKTPPRRPKTSSKRPKTPPERPKTFEDGPRCPQDALKTPSRRSQKWPPYAPPVCWNICILRRKWVNKLRPALCRTSQVCSPIFAVKTNAPQPLLRSPLARFLVSPGPLGSLFESPLEESDWISGADIKRAQGRVRVLCSDVTLTSFVLHCLFEWLTRFRRPPEELRASDDRGTHLMGFAPGCGWVVRQTPAR